MKTPRWAEILPGTLVWVTLIASVGLSLFKRLWMVYFVIIFDLYWLLRILYYLPYLLEAWWNYRYALRIDWQAKAAATPGYDHVRHLVFLPTYKEDVDVIRETFKNLLNASYPSDRMVVCLPGEARDKDHFEVVASTV